AASLAIQTQPAGGAAGAPLATQPSVRILDAFGNHATNDSTTQVSAAFVANPGSAVLQGTTTVTATGGTVNFSNLRVDVLGTGYTLGFSATGVTGVTSAGFAVTAGAAATIVIQTQPAGAVAGAAFTTQPVLRLHDSF